MRPTRIRDLVLLALVLFVVANLLVWMSYGALPRLPTLAGVTLLVLALVNGGFALALRPRFERRKGTEPVAPVTAVRVLALAKASSVLGAIMLGAWAGLLGYVLPKSARLTAAADDSVTGLVGAGCAVLLAAAGLWLERCCRIPESDEDDRSDRDAGGHRGGRAGRRDRGDEERDASRRDCTGQQAPTSPRTIAGRCHTMVWPDCGNQEGHRHAAR